jgi:hypothetical protein
MTIFVNSDDSSGSISSGIAFSEKVNRAWLRTAVLTAFALIAFAANPVLCRLALTQRKNSEQTKAAG